MKEQGTVRFNVPTVPAEAGPIVELRDHNLRLLDQAQPGRPIQLEAGLYLASVVLPTGESEQQAIEVAPGEAVDVYFGPDETTRGDEPFATHEAALEADLPRDLVLTTGDVSNSAAPTSEWFGRLLRASDGTPLDATELLQAHGYAPEKLSAVTDLSCTSSRDTQDGLLYLQVALPDHIPFNCILPIIPGSETQECRIRVVTTAEAIRATALPVNSALTDSVAAYLATGHLRQAADAVANARKLLLDKVSDPVGAALGGYALLRLGRLDKVEHWVQNLAEWFPALPDGAVIAAEQAARSGRTEQADDWLREAVRRGTPMFADGLSLLATRIRPKCTDATDDEDVMRILEIATLADFAQVVVAFPAAAPLWPADSQYSLDVLDAEDGWQRFRHGEMAALEHVSA
jgi:hypothetical protein